LLFQELNYVSVCVLCVVDTVASVEIQQGPAAE